MCVEWYDVVVEVENRQKENVTFIVVMKMMMMAFFFFSFSGGFAGSFINVMDSVEGKQLTSE